jgi:hypothetical protein
MFFRRKPKGADRAETRALLDAMDSFFASTPAGVLDVDPAHARAMGSFGETAVTPEDFLPWPGEDPPGGGRDGKA